MFAEVIVDITNDSVDKIFDYACGELEVRAGMRVSVPFGKRQIEGYCLRVKPSSDYDHSKIKPISALIDGYPVIQPEMLELLEYMKKTYNLGTADTLRLFIPSEMRKGRVAPLVTLDIAIAPEYFTRDYGRFIKPSAHAQIEVFEYLLNEGDTPLSVLTKSFSISAITTLRKKGILIDRKAERTRTPYKLLETTDTSFVLTGDQQRAADSILKKGSSTLLLHGVTGSGKTEVYMHCLASVLREGKTAIMLVPEISLTPQMLRSLRARFGDSVAILHSGLSAGERFDEWRRLLFGEARIAVGARSAVFAPLHNLGLIIIDEEHDSSYQSESNPRYFTHEVARFRCDYNDCHLLLGSATPSVESYFYAQSGLYQLLEMPNRINKRPLPEIHLINMCKEIADGNPSAFSRMLLDKLDECLENGNQAMIFLNRRGYSSHIGCRICGYAAKCTDCDVALVYHRDEEVLKCHYCDKRYKVLDVCPSCGSSHFRRGYVGTQQLVAELKKRYPDQNILRMDNDTTRDKDAHLRILSQFSSGKSQILVGTQMIAKGHDFPNVTLVGIVDADISLHDADYHSNERTFQLITQVAGRAGRDVKIGEVVLQTYTPKHYVFYFAKMGDYKSFYEKEVNLRQLTKYPPFGTVVRVMISSEDEASAGEQLKQIYLDIRQLSENNPGQFFYLAAMKSPLKRIKNRFRLQVLMRIDPRKREQLLPQIFEITNSHAKPDCATFVEINPSSLA